MSDEGSGKLIYKVVGGVFATIIAPLIVAVGVKLLDTPAAPQAGAPDAGAAAPPAAAGPAAAGTVTNEPPATNFADPSLAVEAQPRVAPQPTRTIHLFNGVNLDGFDTYLGSGRPKGKPLAKNHDPKNVFTVHDGMIHVTGEMFGGLVTQDEFEDYRLTIEYRWGEQTWPPREENARTSGVFLHGAGPPLAASNRQTARHPRCIRCLIGEGETGGLLLLGSTPKDPISVEATAEPLAAAGEDRRMPQFQYRPDAAPTTITHGYLARLDRPPGWRDVKGFHGRRDIEHPAGEWNILVCTCRGPRISIRLNGKLVNEILHSSLRRGRITLQSNHAEIFFRRVDLEQFASEREAPST